MYQLNKAKTSILAQKSHKIASGPTLTFSHNLNMDFLSLTMASKTLCNEFYASVLGSRMCFHALSFARSRGSCLDTRPLGRVLKHLPRDPASVVNAMKQIFVIVILAYFTLFQPNSH